MPSERLRAGACVEEQRSLGLADRGCSTCKRNPPVFHLHYQVPVNPLRYLRLRGGVVFGYGRAGDIRDRIATLAAESLQMQQTRLKAAQPRVAAGASIAALRGLPTRRSQQS